MQPDFTWITDSIAVGNQAAAHDSDLRASEGFLGVVSLDGSIDWDLAEAKGYDDFYGLRLIDGPGNSEQDLLQALTALVQMVEDSAPVLVHCHAGRSRSVSLVACYLAYQRKVSLAHAYSEVAAKREVAIQDGLPETMQRVLREIQLN